MLRDKPPRSMAYIASLVQRDICSGLPGSLQLKEAGIACLALHTPLMLRSALCMLIATEPVMDKHAPQWATKS